MSASVRGIRYDNLCPPEWVAMMLGRLPDPPAEGADVRPDDGPRKVRRGLRGVLESAEAVKEAVGRVTGVLVSEIEGPSQLAEVVYARALAAKGCRDLGMTHREIGAVLGGRSDTLIRKALYGRALTRDPESADRDFRAVCKEAGL